MARDRSTNPETTHTQTNFTAGEVSPRLLGRSDLTRYYNGAARIENFTVQQHGGLIRRSGTRYVAAVKTAAQETRLIPFQFSITQSYILEFGNQYVRFYRDGDRLMDDGALESDAGGSTTPYEIVSPWTTAQVPDLKFTQSADILFLCHPDTKTYQLERLGDVLWEFIEFQWADGASVHRNASAITMTPSATSGDKDETPALITITASSAFFVAGHVDNIIRIRQGSSHVWGYAQIKTVPVGDGPHATCLAFTMSDGRQVGRNFTNTSASATWRISSHRSLRGPYNTVNLDDKNKMTLPEDTPKVVGSSIQITASKDTFVSTDVERTMRVKFGADWATMSIKKVVSATAVDVVLIEALSAITPPTSDWRLGTWSDAATDGWPWVPQFWQGRLWFGGSNSNPQTVWGTVTSDFNNFSPNATDGVTVADDNAITHDISSDRVNDVRWILGMPKGLVVGTGGEEFLLHMGSGDVATPSTTRADPHLSHGSMGRGKPQRAASGAILFLQAAEREVREIAYNFQNDQLLAPNMVVLSEHITSGPLPDERLEGQTSYAQAPNNIFYALRNDGQLLAMTYERPEEVVAWSRWIIGGDIPGDAQARVESIATIRDVEKDQTWVVVQREIGGVTKRYIEYFEQQFDTFDRQDDAFFVDAGKTAYTSQEITGISNASPGVVTHAAPTPVFAAGDRVRIRNVKGMTQVNDITFKVAASPEPTETTFALATLAGVAVDTTGYTAYTGPGGEVAKEITVVAGLDHLEGQVVTVLADGATHPDKTVASNQITLDLNASKIQVGLGYRSLVETLPVLPRASQADDPRGRQKRIKKIYTLFNQTVNGKYGQVDTDLTNIPFRQGTDTMDNPPSLFTGTEEMEFPGTHERDNQVVIAQDDPLPMTLLSLSIKIGVYGP